MSLPRPQRELVTPTTTTTPVTTPVALTALRQASPAPKPATADNIPSGRG
jgi:hypothetical protein